MKKGFAIVVLFCLLLGMAHAAPSENHRFRIMDTSTGLSDNQINQLFLDSKGFIWAGTLSGFNFYDGYNFISIGEGDEEKYKYTTNIERIYEDHLGIFWIRLFDNSTVFYNPVNDAFSNHHVVFDQSVSINPIGISGVVVDNDSNLWISNNGSGLYKYTSNNKTIQSFRQTENETTSISSDFITDMLINHAGNIVIVNNAGTIEEIHQQTGKVINRYKINDKSLESASRFLYLTIDSDGDYWIFSHYKSGLYHLNINTLHQTHFSIDSKEFRISNDLIREVIQDSYGKIWVGTDHGGINIIDKTDFSVTVIKSEEGIDNALNHNSITSMVLDSLGGIWIGTYKGGVNYYHPHLFQFGLIKKNPYDKKSFPVSDVTCFAEDKAGNLWIGTNENGLVYFNRSKGTYHQHKHQENNPNSLSSNVIISLCVDSQDQLWVATYQGGLNRYDGKKFHHCKHDPTDNFTIAGDVVWKVFEDSQGRIWVGTLGSGLDLYDNEKNRFIHYKSGSLNSIRSNYVQDIFETSDQSIWVGTTNGIDILESSTGRFGGFPGAEKTDMLSNYVITSMNQDSRGWIWIGTRSGLNCYNPLTDSLIIIRDKDGLPDNIISSIQIDGSDNLWISTRKGISNIQVSEGNSFSKSAFRFINYNANDGLQGNDFNINSGFKTSKGELAFGGINGFNLFNPAAIVENRVPPKVFFTGLKLENVKVKVNEDYGKGVIINQAMYATDEIKLAHNQNAFSILFSSNNYIHPGKVQYRYMLDKVNPDWITTDAQNRMATYTNLDHGTYNFRVKASNGDGIWNNNETVLKIIITPPFYASTIAFIFYFVLAFIIIQLSFRMAIERIRARVRRTQEKIEHQRLLDMETMKTKFFTNVSHEFRTPLTLIISPLEKLIQKSNDVDFKSQLRIVDRNAKKLLNLVNQLLDLRKLEAQPASLTLSYGNIVAFIREITDSFFSLYENKGIIFGYETSIQQYDTFFDQYKIEKIIFNLLSNAFKFTPRGGKVTLSLTLNNNKIKNKKYFDGHEYLEIRVSDTGIGIAEDKIDKIFDRFYQTEDVSNSELNQGSGIGLSITKEFVHIHQGNIQVESYPKLGSSFTVRIPFGLNREHSKESIETVHVFDDKHEESLDALDDEKLPSPKSRRASILIVEDNDDLRSYLKANLEANYLVYEAENGKEAWDKTLELQPSLVVSDIMMPLMDGLELCRLIKTDPAVSHIPILLLTARTTLEQKLEGLGIGADDYITKPFNVEILELRIKKLIETRIAFHHKLNQGFKIEPGEIGITSLDEKFMQKALSIVEVNISNANFSVEELSNQLGMSRGHLYNKITALTGKSPVEFIRVMRIKRAAQLLEKSQMMVSSIAYEVGFNSTKYFGKYFKDEYGLTPSAYVKLKNKNYDKLLENDDNNIDNQ